MNETRQQIMEEIHEVEEPLDQPVEQNDLPKVKKCYVIGNGRSIKGIDFKKLEGDTFGMTMAYRYWRTIGWFPDYYINIDHVVLNHHHKDIQEFINQDKCKGYLLSRSILQTCPDLKDNKKVLFLEDLQRQHGNPFRYLIDWCSGSCAFLFAVILGYNEINTMGIDCNYVEMIPECKEQPDGTLIITKTPEENPNYFVDDYQQEGDVFNKPNCNRVHKRSWEDLTFLLTGFVHLNRLLMNVYAYTDDKTEGLSKYFTKKDIKALLDL
tara:strand:+ start:744 stop:1544 length:801 start_codon:yes stop_codon:yes gene_type:complete